MLSGFLGTAHLQEIAEEQSNAFMESPANQIDYDEQTLDLEDLSEMKKTLI